MINLSNLLINDAPQDLIYFVSSCTSDDDLVKKLEGNPSSLVSILKNIKVEGNEPLVARLLYHVDLNDLEKNPELKKVETTLRNRGMLNRVIDSDFVLKEEGGEKVEAHRVILALESQYFGGIKGFIESKKGELEMKKMELSPQPYKLVIDYLYLPDEKRKEFVSALDKTLLLDMAKLADYWGIDELKNQCDEELCNSLGELKIEKTDIEGWIAQSAIVPKFTQLLGFIKKVAGEGDIEAIIDEMQTPAGAARFAAKCTPEEIDLFATLKTNFGKACQIPPDAFGKAEWEKTFPITIDEVPRLPPNIHEILEQEDPCEPGKKLKETCLLFLRPKEVVLHEAGGDKKIILGFEGVEELAMNANNKELRTNYETSIGIRAQMNQIPVAESCWVLMRKEIIPGSENKSFTDQELLLKGNFEASKVLNAILLGVITYASKGECVHGRGRNATHARCQEQVGSYRTVVGGFTKAGNILIGYDPDDNSPNGLSGSWKLESPG